MPAPIGNQYALGNKGGRPKVPFNPETELNELLKWALTDEALVIRMFAPTRGYSNDTLLKWCRENEEFSVIYNMAKELIGSRRELLLIKNNSATPFQRYAAFYDSALHEFERKDKKEDVELSKSIPDESKPITVNIVDYSGNKNIDVTQ